ncbi:hypothetical protein RRG08_005685 [Elysia crispata]|uniref:Uncharacterized protein n=1 Tax=Elysia crispata TaxID=231223 RepID=A0AAE0YDF4_9GAST|nr:hypothetical protein RRG08_005685 [Elysia crispata]
MQNGRFKDLTRGRLEPQSGQPGRNRLKRRCLAKLSGTLRLDSATAVNTGKQTWIMSHWNVLNRPLTLARTLENFFGLPFLRREMFGAHCSERDIHYRPFIAHAWFWERPDLLELSQ